MANVTEKPSDVNRLAGERGPEPAPLFVEPLSASVDLPMKRAVPTLRFSIRKPRSPRRGFRLLWTLSYRCIRLACGPRGSDETIFPTRRKRPETDGEILMIRRIKGDDYADIHSQFDLPRPFWAWRAWGDDNHDRDRHRSACLF
jgi:hypothetical protein